MTRLWPLAKNASARSFSASLFLALVACALGSTGCGSARRPDGLDPSALPAAVRADYEVFAQRCSKCHTLARPLNAGITDDAYWRIYVTRMRHMQGSGISELDAERILRFLHHYSAEQKAKKGAS